MTVSVEVLQSPTEAVLSAINRLLPQVSSSAVALDAGAVSRIIAQPGTSLLLARVGGQVVGMLTLVIFPIPSGLRAWIEDVVVDKSARRHGVGTALTEEATRRARASGVRTIDLTSRPTREAAIRLYTRLGFQARETYVYRLSDIDRRDS
jgi:ribosomal protein S18 acetylase RimI-like enzyme